MCFVAMTYKIEFFYFCVAYQSPLYFSILWNGRCLVFFNGFKNKCDSSRQLKKTTPIIATTKHGKASDGVIYPLFYSCNAGAMSFLALLCPKFAVAL